MVLFRPLAVLALADAITALPAAQYYGYYNPPSVLTLPSSVLTSLPTPSGLVSSTGLGLVPTPSSSSPDYLYGGSSRTTLALSSSTDSGLSTTLLSSPSVSFPSSSSASSFLIASDHTSPSSLGLYYIPTSTKSAFSTNSLSSIASGVLAPSSPSEIRSTSTTASSTSSYGSAVSTVVSLVSTSSFSNLGHYYFGSTTSILTVPSSAIDSGLSSLPSSTSSLGDLTSTFIYSSASSIGSSSTASDLIASTPLSSILSSAMRSLSSSALTFTTSSSSFSYLAPTSSSILSSISGGIGSKSSSKSGSLTKSSSTADRLATSQIISQSTYIVRITSLKSDSSSSRTSTSNDLISLTSQHRSTSSSSSSGAGSTSSAASGLSVSTSFSTQVPYDQFTTLGSDTTTVRYSTENGLLPTLTQSSDTRLISGITSLTSFIGNGINTMPSSPMYYILQSTTSSGATTSSKADGLLATTATGFANVNFASSVSVPISVALTPSMSKVVGTFIASTPFMPSLGSTLSTSSHSQTPSRSAYIYGGSSTSLASSVAGANVLPSSSTATLISSTIAGSEAVSAKSSTVKKSTPTPNPYKAYQDTALSTDDGLIVIPGTSSSVQIRSTYMSAISTADGIVASAKPTSSPYKPDALSTAIAAGDFTTLLSTSKHHGAASTPKSYADADPQSTIAPGLPAMSGLSGGWLGALLGNMLGAVPRF